MATTQHEANILHLWLFSQDRLWVDVHGCEHIIADMDLDYIDNVIGFIRHRQIGQWERWLDEEANAGRMHARRPSAEADQRDHAKLHNFRRQASGKWLEATPLMRALRERAEVAVID